MKGNYDRKITFDDFTGGIADHYYLMADNQFVDGKNVDIRSEIPFVSVQDKPESIVTGLTKDMTCAVDNYSFGEDGYGYTLTTGVNMLVTGDSDDIVGCAKFNERYLWFTDNGSTPYIGKIEDLTPPSDWTTATGYTNNWSPSGWTTYRKDQGNYGVSTIVFQGNLYFTNANQILILDTSDVVTQGLNNLTSDIVGLTYSGSRMKIYLADGRILFWDGVSGGPNEVIEIGEPIVATHSYNGVDTIVCGGSGGIQTTIWRVAGYEIVKIRNDDYWSSFTGSAGSYAIATLNDITYIPGGGAMEGIYTYGSLYRGVSNSWVYNWSTSSQGYDYSSIYLIHSHNGNIRVQYRDENSNKGIDKLVNNSANSGYVVLRPIGHENSERKVLRAVEINGYFPNGSSNLVLEYEKDLFGDSGTGYDRSSAYNRSDANWDDLIDTADASDTQVTRLFGTGYDIEFYDLQAKITLNNAARLGRITFYGDYIKE